VYSPPFGQADLTNCERELIHLAGSIQPHGVLLVLREPGLEIVQASANAPGLLGAPLEWLLGRPVAELGGDIDVRLRALLAAATADEPVPLRCHVAREGRRHAFEGCLHRHPAGGVIVELEAELPDASSVAAGLGREPLREQLLTAVQRFSAAASIGTLADAVVTAFRQMTGYDRVMVYKFDPDGHGKIIAEARDPRLDSLLGHHYPASDIPQRARSLYLRNRVRVLVDVHYAPQALVPQLLPLTGDPLDMSLCRLRSMSPLHLQYLKNMGVTGTLVASLVREGRLWGLVAAHHYSPRNIRPALRAAADLLAEVASTRITAIENYAHAQVALMVRRLEHRLIEATSTEGDWRFALFRNPRTLLQPLEATGAALFHDGELLTAGEVPSTPELRSLLAWVDSRHAGAPFACSSVGKENPELDLLTPIASGVLAVKLSTSRPDYLMWFRKEQLLTVTWAGDPSKPMLGNDPMDLSPRRSFAAWSEIVRGTALPWSSAELALAGAIGMALVDIIVQVHAVRMLVAEHQLSQTRATVGSSREPAVIADTAGKVLFCNEAFLQLGGAGAGDIGSFAELAALFSDPANVGAVLAGLLASPQPWRGELQLKGGRAEPLAVSLRAEPVPGRDGETLGFILILADLREAKRAAAARLHLEQALQAAAQPDPMSAGMQEADEVIASILANASLAAMDIADAGEGMANAALIEELEASTRRAAALYDQIRSMPE